MVTCWACLRAGEGRYCGECWQPPHRLGRRSADATHRMHQTSPPASTKDARYWTVELSSFRRGGGEKYELIYRSASRTG
jgi:hypothetical protein